MQQARAYVAEVVDAERDDVVFTSGATEANNIAILGLAKHGLETGKKHVISTAIEHKAVLEPLDELKRRGLEVTLLKPNARGCVDADAVQRHLRSDTLLVSVMHMNNETGVVQPVDEVAAVLSRSDAFFHVDAAQSFGKLLRPLTNGRIDMMSVSGHKLYGPKGIGALVVRRRNYRRPPLTPLGFGGGQERGLRPGTLPVALIAGLGEAARLAVRDADKRLKRNTWFREKLLDALAPLEPIVNGDAAICGVHVVNFSLSGVDSEAAIVALKEIVAISNGSACTSQSYEPSHVLLAMGLDDERVRGALRFSWSHLTPLPNIDALVEALRRLR